MKTRIDQNLCEACGICGKICPRHIPETNENDNGKITKISQDRADLCMECRHCVAVCPNKAIQVESLKEYEFIPVKEMNINDDQMLSLLQQRRSVRRYKNKKVPREVIDRIIDAVHCSPTGSGKMTTGVTVIDNPELLGELSDLLYDAYEELGKALKNPIARFMIRKKRGKNKLMTLQNFVMPGMQWYIRWYREGKSNEIFRDCPALMLFHSPIDEPVGAENCLVAAFHASLMANVMNIGSCFNDLIPPMCNREKKIRNLIGLAEEREVYAGLTLGYPKFKFERTIPRKLAEVNYLE